MADVEKFRAQEQAQRLYQVRKTVTEMLVARGYLVPQDELDESFDQFKAKFGDNPRRGAPMLRMHKKPDSPDQIIIFFPEKDKVGAKEIEECVMSLPRPSFRPDLILFLHSYYKHCKTESAARGIIVYQTSITPFAKTMLQHMEGLVIELFKEAELLVNITKHVLVPKHHVLSDDDKQTLLARYKLKETQLPRIQVDDPVAKFYGLRPGQVVKIIRRSETAGRYVTYRLVI